MEQSYNRLFVISAMVSFIFMASGEITLEKVTDDQTINGGESATYDLTITNLDTNNPVSVTYSLSDQDAYMSYVTRGPPTLDASGEAVVRLVVNAIPSTPTGDYSNSVIATPASGSPQAVAVNTHVICAYGC